MADPFTGEIRMFSGNYAPPHWAFCHGQLLAIYEYQALYSLLGTRFGGNGTTVFALPDMRGRAPMHWGTGPGLTLRQLGERGGATSVALTVDQIPNHTHDPVNATRKAATGSDPTLATFADASRTYATDFTAQPLRSDAIRMAGESAPHENRQPLLTVNFIICLQGYYPPRS